MHLKMSSGTWRPFFSRPQCVKHDVAYSAKILRALSNTHKISCGFIIWYSNEWLRDHYFNTLRPRQISILQMTLSNKCILLNENNWILIKIPLRFVSNGSFDDMPTLFGHRSRQLSEPVMGSKLHICVIRPPSVKWCSEKCETYISMNNMIHFHIFVTTIQGHLFHIFSE